jgi:hypothetical protein
MPMRAVCPQARHLMVTQVLSRLIRTIVELIPIAHGLFTVAPQPGLRTVWSELAVNRTLFYHPPLATLFDVEQVFMTFISSPDADRRAPSQHRLPTNASDPSRFGHIDFAALERTG